MPDAAERCPWKTDDLLDKVGAARTPRTNCGLTNGAFTEAIQTAFDCFSDAQARGEAGELTLIQCTDCWIADTFVALPPNGLFRVFTEYDNFGDSIRVSRVDTCSEIRHAEGSEVSCARPMTLFACQGELSDVR